MITAAIFQKMNEDGVAGLVANENFFWEQVPLDEHGNPIQAVWLVTRGGETNNSPKGLNLRTTVDFYVAFNNKIKTEWVHQEIRKWIVANRGVCELRGTPSTNPEISYAFDNIRIFPTNTPANNGVTESGLIVKVASAMIVYDLAN